VLALGLALGAALAVACVLLVARPFVVGGAGPDAVDELDPIERRRIELEEERDRALAALKELEFDHRTGKIADADYRAIVGDLRRQAADALRALEPGTSRAMTELAVPNPPAPEPAPQPVPEPTPQPVPEPAPVPHVPPTPPTIPEPTPAPHVPPEQPPAAGDPVRR